MRHHKVTFALVVLGLLASSAFARAQSPAVINIDFAFTAGTTKMLAGSYRISQEAGVEIALSQVNGKAAAVMPVITYLGRHDNDQVPELVFDVLPDGPSLAEVWFPGFDGYLVLATRGPHKHQVVQGK